MSSNNWIKTKDLLPKDNVVVDTKVQNDEGTRNEQELKKVGGLWFFPDGSMYVYYTPTHWRPKAQSNTQSLNQ